MARYIFGIDVGGTTVKMGLFGEEGTLIEKWEIPTITENGGEQILPDVAKSVLAKIEERSIAKEDIIGVGIGAPGPIDAEGVVHKTANLGWGVFNIPQTLAALVDLPVKAGNDANVAALGEMWQGGGAGYKNLVAVTLGTGVGGGVICEGRILTGAGGAGGEIGHIHIEDNETDRCGCGNKGCLEQYASATGIVKLANKKLQNSDMDSILRSGEVTAKTVFDAVKLNDALAVEVAEEFGDYLGKGLAVVNSVIDPEIFVIGGGVSKAGNIILDYIKRGYKKYAFHVGEDVQFALATLGNDAGIYGAARLVME